MSGRAVRWLILLVPFLIAFSIILVVILSPSVSFDTSVLRSTAPYISLFAFSVLFEYAMYRAHIYNAYINGIGVITISVLCWLFFGLPLLFVIFLSIPVSAILMLGAGRRSEDEAG